MVQSDATLSERTFALLIPPESLTIISTCMMLFGINLVIVRHLNDRQVSRFSSWRFLIVGLYTIGVLQRGFSDLYHVHLGHQQIQASIVTKVALMVWGPGLGVAVLEVLAAWKKPDLHRLHNWSLWWTSVAFVIAIAVFGATLMIENHEHMHSLLLPWITLLVSSPFCSLPSGDVGVPLLAGLSP